MKIEYSILWLDDKIDEFIEDEHINTIQEYLIGNGFKPNIIPVSNFTDFEEKLNNNYDLILTDYHLDHINGDKVVQKIREQLIQTEILFYTAQASLKDTQKINRVSFLETGSKSGTHAEIVINELKNLIDLTIRKFQHIVTMRGMIMHETSSLDEKMQRILQQYINNESNNEAISLIAVEIFKDLKKTFESKSKKIDRYCKNNNLNQISKDNFIFSANFKIKTIQHILKNIGLEDFSDDYKQEINNIRNQFAHAVLLVDEETEQEYFKSSTDIIFNEDLCKTIRQNIIKHEENLNKLEEKIRFTIK